MKVKDFELKESEDLGHISVKESVLPFSRFSGVDIVLGPEMKSTGEVMGIASDFGGAFAKSQICANQALPQEGTIFISVKDEDKRQVVFLAKKLFEMGFAIVSTRGTAKVLRSNGVTVEEVAKVGDGPNDLATLIKNGTIKLIINTPSGERSQSDMRSIRAAAILHNIPCITTLQGAWAAVNGMHSCHTHGFSVRSLQDHYRHQELIKT